MDTRTRAAIGVGLAVLAMGVGAASLPDPTRPAVGLSDGSPGAATPGQPASGLQAIVRRANGAPAAAVINGELVNLGGRSGDATLVTIGEDSVVLRGMSGDETLRLTPGIGKKAPAAGKVPTKQSKHHQMEKAKP